MSKLSTCNLQYTEITVALYALHLVIWIVNVIWLLPVLTHATSNTGGFGEFS